MSQKRKREGAVVKKAKVVLSKRQVYVLKMTAIVVAIASVTSWLLVKVLVWIV